MGCLFACYKKLLISKPKPREKEVKLLSQILIFNISIIKSFYYSNHLIFYFRNQLKLDIRPYSQFRLGMRSHVIYLLLADYSQKDI